MNLPYQSCSQASAIVQCRRCPRLIKHCQSIARLKKKSFADWTYWGKPVPSFGTETVSLLIVGLAPAAHGANRTGRMFTGDRSGLWLYRSLKKAGFAKTDGYQDAADNELIDCQITSVIHCAPPENKPTREEIENCRPFLKRAIEHSRARAILCLGSIAWNETLRVLEAPRVPFSHGGKTQTTMDGQKITVYSSYHPSQQNTFTKRLTEKMFDQVFNSIRKSL